jgi:hypothetical protein
MKTLFIFITALLLHTGQSVALAQQPSVSLQNVQLEYKSLAEVKPILVNTGDRSIYLLPQECGEALVSFLNGEYWWYSDLKDCPEAVEPIEIKAGEIYHAPSLVLRIEQDEEKFIEDRVGRPGTYRIIISYSFTPIYRDGKPEMKRSISKKFTITK